MRGITAVFVCAALLFCACNADFAEPAAKNAAVYPDALGIARDSAEDYLDPLAFLPEGGELVDCFYSGGELTADFRGDICVRFAYESQLQHMWYDPVDPVPATSERASTFLHPTGWRVAICDNRRSGFLKELYGESEYHFRVCIKKIGFDPAFFPKYPAGDSDLFLPGSELAEFDEYPDEVLPENFPGLPENALFKRAALRENGLTLTFFATADEYMRWVEKSGYSPDGDAFADANGNYMRSNIFLVRAYEQLREEEYSRFIEISQAEEDARRAGGIKLAPEQAEMMRETGQFLPLEELPQYTGDLQTAIFYRVELQVVRYDWLPDWWKEREK